MRQKILLIGRVGVRQEILPEGEPPQNGKKHMYNVPSRYLNLSLARTRLQHPELISTVLC